MCPPWREIRVPARCALIESGHLRGTNRPGPPATVIQAPSHPACSARPLYAFSTIWHAQASACRSDSRPHAVCTPNSRRNVHDPNWYRAQSASPVTLHAACFALSMFIVVPAGAEGAPLDRIPGYPRAGVGVTWRCAGGHVVRFVRRKHRRLRAWAGRRCLPGLDRHEDIGAPNSPNSATSRSTVRLSSGN